ncbi:MAG: hypothetical protein AAB482_00490 [Patescibacteria group bacterium]
MFYKKKHIISARHFSREDLITAFRKSDYIREMMTSSLGRRQLAETLKHSDGRPWRAKIMFDEPSTRTMESFLEACDTLGAKWRTNTNMKQTSSMAKGESLEDTVDMSALYGYDVLIFRHDGREKNAMRRAADTMEAYGHPTSIISAGEGNVEHPTQMVLDLYTVWREFGDEMEHGKLTYAFVGDIADSRTIHSDIIALRNFGGTVFTVSSRDNNLPKKILHYRGKSPVQLSVTKMESWEEIASEVDVWYFTRLQHERKSAPPNPEFEKQYITAYGVNDHFLSEIRRSAIIMHPLPRGGEISGKYPSLADSRIVYRKQVYNGWICRMALLSLLREARQ